MNARSVGATIAKMRRRCGMTQAQLATRLNISDKTVSRWENGIGYPEVTIFPTLAAVLGVTVDYLLTGERKGIAVAGTTVTDIVKIVDCYPQMGMLANVLEIRKAVGGCAPNTAIDLAKIDRSIPISVLGRIGDDEYGRFIVSQLSRYGIGCEGLLISPDYPTSFTDVISLRTGERTFLCTSGANTVFAPEDVDIGSLNCVIFHIGYLLLLDMFDQSDPEYGTAMAKFLCSLQEKGIKTSIDVVSHSTADYPKTIIPALKYSSYAIMNEIESSMLSQLPPRNEDGTINIANIRATMEYMAQCGVKEKVIVHCREAGFSLDVPSGTFTQVASLNVPASEIRGNVGAGDAFCAGCLYAIYQHYDDRCMLEFASAAAACSLFSENSTDGMLSRNEIEQLAKKYGRQTDF